MTRRARTGSSRSSIGLTRGSAFVVTLHRPSNVDDSSRLESIADALSQLAEQAPVIFAAHPRTAQRLAASGLSLGKTRVLEPLPYPKMLNLVEGARVVITDSGGLQEETTALGVPCLTVRENTERPITVTEGTNALVPDPRDLFDAAMRATAPVAERRPEGWDGRAAERIIEAFRARDGSARRSLDKAAAR